MGEKGKAWPKGKKKKKTQLDNAIWPIK